LQFPDRDDGPFVNAMQPLFVGQNQVCPSESHPHTLVR